MSRITETNAPKPKRTKAAEKPRAKTTRMQEVTGQPTKRGPAPQ